ncbi:hypothetical protein KAR91_03430 [Candidatus Pacearchaeota archaeon]|nr:hypothetical protein [Candidatus Pacearchaeota archaeon]
MAITTTNYADLKEVKERCNIPQSNTNFDEKLATNMRDADSFVNVQAGVHTDTPIENPDKQLISLASGLAASYYNYWQTPAKDRSIEGIKQWEKRLSDHLKAFYGQEDISGHTGRTFLSTTGVTGAESGTGTTP